MREVVWRGHKARSACSAFMLVEVIVAVGLGAIMFVGLYLGFTQGFAIIQLARENLRATQILQEKAETIRLFTWDDVLAATASTYVSTNYFSPLATSGGNGTAYTVTREVGTPPIKESYAGDIKLVTFTVKWTSGNLLRQR